MKSSGLNFNLNIQLEKILPRKSLPTDCKSVDIIDTSRSIETIESNRNDLNESTTSRRNIDDISKSDSSQINKIAVDPDPFELTKSVCESNDCFYDVLESIPSESSLIVLDSKLTGVSNITYVCSGSNCRIHKAIFHHKLSKI